MHCMLLAFFLAKILAVHVTYASIRVTDGNGTTIAQTVTILVVDTDTLRFS